MMYRLARFALLFTIMILARFGIADSTQPPDANLPASFTFVDIFIDPHDQPLAAYQVEFVADPQRVTLVGIEGGDHPAYTKPPYYDPAALNRNRVILAAFDTRNDLPTARTRVATLHLRVVGDEQAEWSVKLHTAGNPQGKPIPAEVSISQGAMR